MDSPDGPLISVQAEAEAMVSPDAVRLHVAVRVSRNSKQVALSSAAHALEAVTSALEQLGGSAMTPANDRDALTWSAHSATTYVERDKNGRATSNVTASVSVAITARDFDLLAKVGSALTAADDVHVQHVDWLVDSDNAGWARVRAAAIEAALEKASDYAVALGTTIARVEHIADAGMLGDARERHQKYSDSMSGAVGGAWEPPDTPSLDPVPQLLSASIDARLVAHLIPVPRT